MDFTLFQPKILNNRRIAVKNDHQFSGPPTGIVFLVFVGVPSVLCDLRLNPSNASLHAFTGASPRLESKKLQVSRSQSTSVWPDSNSPSLVTNRHVPYHGRVPFGNHRQSNMSPEVQNTPTYHREVTVTKYASRHWAVWIGKELIAVTVYRKGARRVAELFQDLLPANQTIVQKAPEKRA